MEPSTCLLSELRPSCEPKMRVQLIPLAFCIRRPLSGIPVPLTIKDGGGQEANAKLVSLRQDHLMKLLKRLTVLGDHSPQLRSKNACKENPEAVEKGRAHASRSPLHILRRELTQML
ncbi:uncharacterized protein BO97DRAFT_72262 [Aspergillus homomorphus CBS 101889]|uniref:Uncharacterized protein n=1 Tax=Aspergillus homomorphus (strain CBS 101889) TaxID=1450537 RepID=A0A395I8R2_ASPHC|nr:hypothetical protein BO97DRAFT_72262 [Aspergillus homomorphus CBS 101889]RAL16660.1 hypothetical protein BO97DRAFT_72262 [Aspergillus homomorphus CBS 101889]